MIPQVARDTYVLLGLGIVVLAFVAYELAGLTVDGMHTISYIAKQNHWLFVTILAFFMLLGLIAPAWWVWHITRGTISR